MAFAAGLLACAGGGATLAGWWLDAQRLTDWPSLGISTQPNTALSLMFAGAALLALVLGRVRCCAGLAAVPVVLGGATLAEHLFAIDLGIDAVLLMERAWGDRGTTTPGRMGMPASVALLTIGTALILRTRSPASQRASNLLALLTLPLAAVSLLAYLFGANPLFDSPRYTAIAFQTSLMLFALAAGVLASHWRSLPVSVLVEDGGAGEVARRSLPFIVLVPLGLSLFRYQAQASGLLSPAVAVTVLLLVLMGMMGAGLLWVAALIRRRESALAAMAAQLREADRRKDEFLATLAHELRNPLAPLANGLELMRRDAALGAQPQQLVAMMQRQTALLRRMVDDLLDISRITRGHYELRRDTIDLREVVARAVETTRNLAVQHAHTLQIDLPDAPLCVFGDADRLSQAIANLLHNACKYTPDGGRIEVMAAQDGGEARIVVRDNGVGIPPHLRERVFEVFTQVDTSLERSHGGLGIGLTLVRRIVDKHGGLVSAHAPATGVGSEFVVALPLSRVAQDA